MLAKDRGPEAGESTIGHGHAAVPSASVPPLGGLGTRAYLPGVFPKRLGPQPPGIEPAPKILKLVYFKDSSRL